MSTQVTKLILNKRSKLKIWLSKYKTKDTKVISRRFFILEGVTGIGQFSLTTGAFLAGFINLLKGSEQLNGMIAVIPAIAGIFQIFSSLIFERLKRRKKTIVGMAVVLRLLLSIVYFIPILLIPTGLGIQAFIVMYGIAYSINALLAPAIANWMVDLTPIAIRGQYLANRDKISLAVTALLTIVLGRVLDFSKYTGNPNMGFVIVGIILLVLGILNVIALLNITELEGKNIQKIYKMKDVIKTPIKNAGFRKVILLFIVWSFAFQVGGPYIAVYMVTKLNLSYTYMMSLSVISTIVRVIFSSYWGRVADKKSWFLSSKFSIAILAIVHFSWGFVSLENYSILVPILHILGGFAWGGIAISLFNIQFLFAKREGRTMYLGLNAAIGGLFSWVAVWIGGKVISILKDNVVNVFGLSINSMQMVFFLSGILLGVCPLLIKFYIERGKPEVEVE